MAGIVACTDVVAVVLVRSQMANTRGIFIFPGEIDRE